MNVLITGATKGIGRAITTIFAQNGAHIAVAARNEADLMQLKQEVEDQFATAKIYPFAADLGKKEEVLAFAKFVKSHFTKVDVLINNVGVFLPGDVLEGDEGSLEQLIEVNLYSAFHLSRAIVPDMVTQQKGHIFNMCSIASLGPRANSGLYVISKYAMLGMSKSMREELKDKGIKVTSVLPGPTWSNAWEGSGFPKERLIPAEEVAQTIWNAYSLGPNAVIEELLIQPQFGDI